METSESPFVSPKIVTLKELERRKDEFDVPEGTIAAFRAGSMPTVVMLRSTGEEYQLADSGDDAAPGQPREL